MLSSLLFRDELGTDGSEALVEGIAALLQEAVDGVDGISSAATKGVWPLCFVVGKRFVWHWMQRQKRKPRKVAEKCSRVKYNWHCRMETL